MIKKTELTHSTRSQRDCSGNEEEEAEPFLGLRGAVRTVFIAAQDELWLLQRAHCFGLVNSLCS